MKKLGLIFAMLFLGWFIPFGRAQDEQFKALFIFNFTKYIEWTDSKAGDFVIAVYGNSAVYDQLVEIAKSKKVGSQTIRIIKAATPADLSKCQLVYFPTSRSEKIGEVIPAIVGNQTLLVTDKPGMISKGAAINLVTVDGKQKFEICKRNIEQKGLNVSASLLRLGIEVQ